MSATSTIATTGTSINTVARCICAATCGVQELTFHVVDFHGLSGGPLVDQFETVEKGLRVWFTMKQLKSVVLEFYDAGGECIRGYEFPVTYESSPSSDERFDVQVGQLRKALGTLPKCEAASYRLLVTYTTKEHMQVDGWSKCKRHDVKDLKKVKLGEKVVNTSAIALDAYVFLGEESNESDVSN